MIELPLKSKAKLFFKIANEFSKNTKIVEFCRVFENFLLTYYVLKDKISYHEGKKIRGKKGLPEYEFEYINNLIIKLKEDVEKLENEQIRMHYNIEIELLEDEISDINISNLSLKITQKGSIEKPDEYKIIVSLHKFNNIVKGLDFDATSKRNDEYLKYLNSIINNINSFESLNQRLNSENVDFNVDEIDFNEACKRNQNKEGVFICSKEITLFDKDNRNISMKDYAVSFLINRILDLYVALKNENIG